MRCCTSQSWRVSGKIGVKGSWGTLRPTASHCIAGNRPREGKRLAQDHNDAGSLGSASPHLMLSYRWKG